jgi:predicted secreted protein
MFNDRRSKKVVLVAHCLMNQNSISDGTADYPSQFTALINLLIENRIGIIQLPCPELTCLGLDRKDKQGGMRPVLMENTRIRGLMCEKANAGQLQSKAEEVATQIQEYDSYGFRVLGVIGVNRSPSCGIETTTKDNREVEGRGVFSKMISEACRKRGYAIALIGVKTSEKEESIKRLRQFIEMGDQQI